MATASILFPLFAQLGNVAGQAFILCTDVTHQNSYDPVQLTQRLHRGPLLGQKSDPLRDPSWKLL